ncbi:hypothetical protein [Cardiobacterium valvarum]|uniref:Uncharacterized protein n=1 Tax=Cardiobacterium valvarum F0432 TaxID=797473 RepID=G9ZI28_9GAMM|nr:hypothetical protein [Cardiobacterium valvarum]EHM52270.1 hypothetical protein HMPREF9080_02437 [Cardiobacterium valvarum F0432]
MHTLDIPYHGHTYRIHLRPPRRNNRRLRLSVDGSGTLYLSHPPRSPVPTSNISSAAILTGSRSRPSTGNPATRPLRRWQPAATAWRHLPPCPARGRQRPHPACRRHSHHHPGG